MRMSKINKIVACLPCRRRLNRTEEDRKERQNSRASPDTADNGQGLGLRHLALIHHEARTTKILALPRLFLPDQRFPAFQATV